MQISSKYGWKEHPNLQKLHRQIMYGLGILLRVVLIRLVPSVHQRISQALRCGHIRLLQLKLVRGEGRVVLSVVLDVGGDRVGVGRQRVSLRLHICQITKLPPNEEVDTPKTTTPWLHWQPCPRIKQSNIELQQSLRTGSVSHPADYLARPLNSSSTTRNLYADPSETPPTLPKQEIEATRMQRKTQQNISQLGG